MDRVRMEKEQNETKELSFQPKILARKNIVSTMSSGDRNLDLYNRSKQHLKSNKLSEEYEFEKSEQELTFKPQINKTRAPQNYKRIDQRVNEIT